MKRSAVFAILLLAIVVVVGFFVAANRPFGPPGPDETTLERAIPPEMLAQMLEAANTTLYRLTYAPGGEEVDPKLVKAGMGLALSDGSIQSGVRLSYDPKTAPPAWVDSFRKLVRDNRKRPYFKHLPACIYSPGIAIRFEKDGKFLDLVICLECQVMEFAWKGKEFSEGTNIFTDLDEMTELVKAAFPEDSELQAYQRKH